MPSSGLSCRLLAAALLMQVFSAWACRCPHPPSTHEAYRYADQVVQARVQQVAEDPLLRRVTATLSVSRAWKAAAPANLEASSADTSCAFTFTPGDELLLFLRRDPSTQRLEARQCSGNQPQRDAGPALKWLQRRAKEFPGPR